MKPDERAFANIVRQHKSTIYTVCYMFSKDEDEVADMFQEVLVNLWRGYDKFRGESSLNTWIYRVSLNTCISADRKRKRIGRHASRLGVIDRAIVLLWLDNLSYEEIGQIIGISTKNVSVKLVRIREQLKHMK